MKKSDSIFEDADYTESNRSYNRVKNYTFTRLTEEQERARI